MLEITKSLMSADVCWAGLQCFVSTAKAYVASVSFSGSETTGTRSLMHVYM